MQLATPSKGGDCRGLPAVDPEAARVTAQQLGQVLRWPHGAVTCEKHLGHRGPRSSMLTSMPPQRTTNNSPTHSRNRSCAPSSTAAYEIAAGRSYDARLACCKPSASRRANTCSAIYIRNPTTLSALCRPEPRASILLHTEFLSYDE